MPSSHDTPVAAIVVTYNRKDSVTDVIRALIDQTSECEIIVVDNASTDGTADKLRTNGYLNQPRIRYTRLSENSGGSGGFCHGLKYAMKGDWEWFWLMDDDAIPDPNALENLLKHAKNPETVYGSAAINKVGKRQKLCWPTVVYENGHKYIVEYPDILNDIQEVSMLPFLGFFIHRNMIERIGYPDAGFFICADDTEYSERIKSQSGKMAIVKCSTISHPLAQVAIYNFGFMQAAYRSLPPWKIYYDVRNKILIAKIYFGYRLWTQTLPGIFLRSILSVYKEKQKTMVLAMTLKAVIDGLLNRKGKTVHPPSN